MECLARFRSLLSGHKQPDVCLGDTTLYGLIRTRFLLIHLVRLEWRKIQRHFLGFNRLPSQVETHRSVKICEARLVGRKEDEHVPAVSTCRSAIQDFGGILTS